ncbi:MAG TPA: hypothetical protein VM536_05895 [Chloroflexia bacterium]|nr:hypothetical protein [Chloroflexia bacterium]
MSCPFAGLATRYTVNDERVSVRICSAVPYERESDAEDLPLPSVCFSRTAWQSCPHYLRLTQRKEIAEKLGLVAVDPSIALTNTGAADGAIPIFEFVEGPERPDRRRPATAD